MDKAKISDKQKIIKRNQRQAYIILFGGIALLLISPYILTRSWLISFSNTGQIGDTIGGVTAPIVNLIAAVLVYLSFRQQLVANEIQIDLIYSAKQKEVANTEKELFLFHYNEIKKALEQMHYTSVHNRNITGKGIAALKIFAQDFSIVKKDIDLNGFHYQVIFTLLDLMELMLDCFNSEVLTTKEKKFFVGRVYNLYQMHFNSTLSEVGEYEKELNSPYQLYPIMQAIENKMSQYDTIK